MTSLEAETHGMNTAIAERLEVGSFMGDIYKEESEREYDDDDEDDGDGEGRGRQMLGFMFGNVDDSGGLDEEYLDQVATNVFLSRIWSFLLRIPRPYGIKCYRV